jgi:hypothetical protein
MEFNSVKGWIWRRRGEDEPSMYRVSSKVAVKVMVICAFSKGWKSDLIFIDGSVSAQK